jgi:eukaryotic-like serine/threonine-protein kinase
VIIQPGMKLQNRYEVLQELGRGGMGSVFKAHDPLLDREVAIKTLSSALSADDSFIQRFQHEARAIARLNHPGIVGIFDVGQDKGVSFIVMEYIAGGSLDDLLKRQSPLPPHRVVELLEQIAVALDFAHSRGFVHRDIKPANILLDEAGKTRITDFGLVKWKMST